VIVYYIIILLMSLAASFASFLFKKSTNDGTILSIIKNKYLYIGGFLYVISALFNIWLLQKMPYFIVVPLGSICYIWTMVIAGLFLKENIRIKKIIGVVFIISGVICITN